MSERIEWAELHTLIGGTDVLTAPEDISDGWGNKNDQYALSVGGTAIEGDLEEWHQLGLELIDDVNGELASERETPRPLRMKTLIANAATAVALLNEAEPTDFAETFEAREAGERALRALLGALTFVTEDTEGEDL